MNVPNMNKQIIFVDSSVQDYQSLIQGIEPAQIFILNENLSAIDALNQALIVLYRGVYESDLLVHVWYVHNY